MLTQALKKVIFMFQFFFKYPSTVFTKGRVIILCAVARFGLLPVLIVAAACGLDLLIRSRLANAAPNVAAIGGPESCGQCIRFEHIFYFFSGNPPWYSVS